MHIDLYNTFVAFKRTGEKKEWCKRNDYSCGSFFLAKQTYDELASTLKRVNYYASRRNAPAKQTTIDGSTTQQLAEKERGGEQQQQQVIILDAICAGLHLNLAYYNGKLKDGSKVYKLVELQQEAFIHPTSVLFVLGEEDIERAAADYLLFADVMRTDRLYIRNVTPIPLDMLKKYSHVNLKQLAREVKETADKTLRL